MYEAKRMLFIYVETPLHAGSGSGLGPVDLPLQRERATGYPMVQASSLKGRLRALYRDGQCGGKDEGPRVQALFGRAGADGESYAGALSVGDARLLLFPVRSLAGVFAWTTSRDALARFRREAELAGLPVPWAVPDEAGEAAPVAGRELLVETSLVLEDYSFAAQESREVAEIGRWLAEWALPEMGYDYWRRQLPGKLALLPDGDFRDFTQHATEVQTHVKLDPGTKTASGSALWTVESLPPDSLLYAPLLAARSRAKDVQWSGEEALAELARCGLERTQLGGDETTGQGWVALRLAGGGA